MAGSTDRRGWRRGRRLAGATALATVLLTPGVAAGADWSPTVTLRTADSVSLAAVVAKGAGVGVVWEEDRPVGPAILYRISQDGGATFGAMKRLDDRPNRRPSAAVCMGDLWIASELRRPEDPADAWSIIVDGKQLDGTGYTGMLITDSDLGVIATEPSIACVGSRFLALAWLQNKDGAGWRAKLSVFDPSPPIPELAGPVYERTIDLGPADPTIKPSVGASNGRVSVLWGRAGDLWYRTGTIASGPSVSLAMAAPFVMASGVGPETAIGVNDQQIVVAYMRANDVITRRNRSPGSTIWSVPWTRLDGDPICCRIAAPFSLSLTGARVLLEAQRTIHDADPIVEEWRLTSDNEGGTFSKVQVGSLGQRAGAFAGTAAAPRMVEAWDDWSAWAGQNHIRFHRRS